VANPDTVYSIFRSSLPLFTPAAVLEHARAMFEGTVIRSVLVTSPTPRTGPLRICAPR
jgi:zinc protease